MPHTAPESESTRLSTRSCRTSWPREAPTERRTAISFCRATARAIRRFATLAQAISSTSPTMHIRTISAVEKLLRSCEYPAAARSTWIVPFMNCSREYGDQSFAAGSDISYWRIWVNSTCSAAWADCARVAGLQAGKHLHPARAAIVHLYPLLGRHDDGLHQNRNANLRRARRVHAGKPRSGNADDRHRIVVDQDLLADHFGIAREARRPIFMAEHDDRMAAVDLIVFGGIENAPGGGASLPAP